MIRKVLHWIGPHSPLGPDPASVLSILFMFLAAFTLLPPIVWFLRMVGGGWWRYWLG